MTNSIFAGTNLEDGIFGLADRFGATYRLNSCDGARDIARMLANAAYVLGNPTLGTDKAILDEIRDEHDMVLNHIDTLDEIWDEQDWRTEVTSATYIEHM